MTAPADEGGVGARYAARLARLAASGMDMHGEARLCAELLAKLGRGPGARVLDAGCGTGRVAVRLAELGFACVGVDVDPSMLAEARRAAPEVDWVLADLADLDLPGRFDLAVAAGNVMALVGPGTEFDAVARVAAHLAPGGLLVAGFGLDRPHLPPGAVVLSLSDYDAWCGAAGLALFDRYATWDGDPYAGGGYAVSVHARA